MSSYCVIGAPAPRATRKRPALPTKSGQISTGRRRRRTTIVASVAPAKCRAQVARSSGVWKRSGAALRVGQAPPIGAERVVSAGAFDHLGLECVPAAWMPSAATTYRTRRGIPATAASLMSGSDVTPKALTGGSNRRVNCRELTFPRDALASLGGARLRPRRRRPSSAPAMRARAARELHRRSEVRERLSLVRETPWR